MTNRQGWTRRQFSQALAASAVASLLTQTGRAFTATVPAGLAFVGNAPANGGLGAIHVYRVSPSGWRHTQVLPAVAPGHLLLHPSLPVLYALHNVAEWKHLPRGAVSAYAIDQQGGRLSLLGSQPLSLSATHPRHATLTADARHMFVAAEGGGMYNLLPVAEDGNLLPVLAIRKEHGLQDGDRAKIASPRAVALHPDGTLLSVDPGQESLTGFELRGHDLVLRDRTRVHAGDGPTQLALSPCGMHAYTLHGAGEAIAVHSLRGDRSLQVLQTCTDVSRANSIVVAPGGRFLLASGEGSTDVLRIAPETGHLSRHARLRGAGQTLSFGAGHVLGLDSSGEVRQTAFDLETGTSATPKTVAHVQNCVSLAFQSADGLLTADRLA